MQRSARQCIIQIAYSNESRPSVQSIKDEMTKSFHIAIAMAIVLFALPRCVEADQLPNVIFVMADDLGIGDISPTNRDCKIKTPNLQAMANEGITFFDAHSPSAVCTPTRYGVLTGRYNWRSRLAKGVLNGRSKHLIPADRPTVAHMLHKAGYHNQMIGKWHLGWDWHKSPKGKGKGSGKDKGNKIDFTKPVKNGPDINGFDGYYGHCGSLDMPPYVWVDTGKITAVPDREEGVNRKDDRYVWYRNGPISPDFKIDEVLPHLFGKSIDHVKKRAAAKDGKPFFLYLALPAPHTPIVPVAPFKDASGMNPYADFVMQVDHHMGELFEAVKEAGIDENTIIFFTSDNGCSPEGNFAALKEFGHDPSAGFRGHKADIYEGGHRVPLIVRWPDGIKGGQSTNAMACLTDLYATLRDITGQPTEDLGGEDSFSLVPAFTGEKPQRASLVSHSIGGWFAIRRGDWKLCLSGGSGGWSSPNEKAAKKQGLPPMQLFNLKDDRGERKNLIDGNPEKLEELKQLLEDEVTNGRSTPGNPVSNDREVQWLPAKTKATTKAKPNPEAKPGDAAAPPNVVVFMVDDLGYMDVGANNPNCFYETPNINAFAKTGLRFTNGYAANPVCSPTRFSLMTGRYPTRVGATNFFTGNRKGKFLGAKLHNRMPLKEITLAQTLKSKGYSTFFAGKWHLGPTEEFFPQNRGFDINKGGWSRGGPYTGKKYFAPFENPQLKPESPEGDHLPARLARETATFIEESSDKPFFAYLCFYSVHTPLIGRPDLVEKYKARAESINGEEFADEEQNLGAKPRKVRILQKHAVYAAMVEAMDEAVGTVLKQLDDSGVAENTIVVFTSDNGGLSTSEGSPTCNLPLRGGKGWVYEGGIREPWIIRYPGVTKAGAVSDVPICSIDVFPTINAAAGAAVTHEVDGVDLHPVLRGGDSLDREALYWHYPHYSNQGGMPGGAIRVGDFKLLERYEDGRVHLYNLKDDIGEQNDLGEQHPQRVVEMRDALHRWYVDTGARFLRQKENGPEPWRPGKTN